jgi:hypothetical protein
MAKTKGKSKIGRPPKHGAYSIVVKQGEPPENRQYIRNYLIEIREGLIRDHGPREEDLSTGQRILIDRATSLLSICRVIEEWIRENGVFVGMQLQPILKVYLSHLNSLRLILVNLGLNQKEIDKIVDLGTYVEQNYGDKGE